MVDPRWEDLQLQLFPLRRLRLPDTPEVALLLKILDDPTTDDAARARVRAKLERIYLESRGTD